MGKALEALVRHIGIKKRFQDFWYKLYRVSLIGMNIGGGASFENSGEKCALKYVKTYIMKADKPVIFDVGANIGGYTKELVKYIKGAEIHSFEPAKVTFNTLCQNVQATNVVLNNFGISDACSEGILHYEQENSGLASLYSRQLDYLGTDLSKSEKVKLDTIDNYCNEKEISHIDFLKIDVEGNELKALNGATHMLKAQRIRAIQIEFGGCNLDSRTYFRDFWNLLHEDFSVYRIIRDGLYEINNYSEMLEIFTCTNYLFINRKYERQDRKMKQGSGRK